MEISNNEYELKNFVPVIKPKINNYSPSPLKLDFKDENVSDLSNIMEINLELNNNENFRYSNNNTCKKIKPKIKNKLLILDALKKRKSLI
jgi:hypothetical protein